MVLVAPGKVVTGALVDMTRRQQSFPIWLTMITTASQ